MALYTPFMAEVGQQVGGQMRQSQQNKLAQSAYMGDQSAMGQLMGVNPALAQKIESGKAKQAQTKLQTAQKQQDRATKAEDRLRKLNREDQDVLGEIFTNAGKFATFEEASAYADSEVSKYPGMSETVPPFTEEAYQQSKSITSASTKPVEKKYIKVGDELVDPETLEVVFTGKAKDKKKKPLNASQAKSAGYLTRMIGAQGEIDKLKKSDKDFDPSSIWERAKANTPLIGNILASEEYQQYKQSADDWIRAKLRQESGAVIATDEMEKEYITYFPQIGDGDKVIKQKVRARKRAEEAMQISSGGKVEEATPEEVDKAKKQSNIAVGTQNMGYEFLGGDPADPNSWKKI